MTIVTLSPSAIVILRERKRPKNLRRLKINSAKGLTRNVTLNEVKGLAGIRYEILRPLDSG